jgi:hypothetical protein
MSSTQTSQKIKVSSYEQRRDNFVWHRLVEHGWHTDLITLLLTEWIPLLWPTPMMVAESGHEDDSFPVCFDSTTLLKPFLSSSVWTELRKVILQSPFSFLPHRRCGWRIGDPAIDPFVVSLVYFKASVRIDNGFYQVRVTDPQIISKLEHFRNHLQLQLLKKPTHPFSKQAIRPDTLLEWNHLPSSDSSPDSILLYCPRRSYTGVARSEAYERNPNDGGDTWSVIEPPLSNKFMNHSEWTNVVVACSFPSILSLQHMLNLPEPRYKIETVVSSLWLL